MTKAKRNSVLYRKIDHPVWSRKIYVKVSPKGLLQEVYPKLKALGSKSFVSIPEIYIKLPYKVYNKKGESVTTYKFVPIAAVAGLVSNSANAKDQQEILPQEDTAATFSDAYLLISNRWDKPNTAAQAYLKRWDIGVPRQGCFIPAGARPVKIKGHNLAA